MSEAVVFVGRIRGVCTADCKYDLDGTCVVCKALDPDRWLVYRIPSEAETRAAELEAAFAQTAAGLGIDPSILRRADFNRPGGDADELTQHDADGNVVWKGYEPGGERE